jgi:hypothetical protein
MNDVPVILNIYKKSTRSGIVLLFGLLPFFGQGQHIIKALPRWMVSSHVQYMVPQHPVEKFLDGHDWGYLVEGQYRIQYNKPLLAGLYFSEAGLSKYVLKYTQSTSTGDVRIREKANTRRLEGGFSAGFYPEVNWLFQPYVQGRFGLALFQSSSILTDRSSQETIERINELAKIVPSYGLDLGIHIVPNIWYIRGDVRIGIVGNPSVTFMALDEENKGTTGYPIDYFKIHTSAGRWFKVSLGGSFLF